MGNNQVVQIDEVKAKFATCEIVEMEKAFQKLAKEGSFRGKSFDKKTFVRLHFPNAQDLGASIFDAMDRSKDGKVTEEEFLLALSLIIRGSSKEKFRYIFMMISFTCGTGQQRVSAAELMKFFSLNFFQPKGMNKKTFEQKVKENVSEYFKLYDKDKDKYLNVNEFQDFAENSFEVTLILEIFLSFEKKFTTPSSEAISGPTGVVHETHVSRTEGGGISIDNMPPAWVQLIREAGIKKKELKDPQTAMMLMEIIAKKLGEKTKQTAQLPQHHPHNHPQNNPQNNPSKIILNPPLSIAPLHLNLLLLLLQFLLLLLPIPTRLLPLLLLLPIPPLILLLLLPLVHNIKESGGGGGEGGGFLSQIKQGTKLKPIEIEVEVEKLSKEDRNDITSALVDAIKNHRVNMNESDDEDDDQDDWDD